MLRRLTSTVLLGLLLFTLFYNSVIWIRYEMNVDEITELFCINKDKPELQCFGKCYVGDELIDFNLLPETPEPVAQEVNYMPILKHFVFKEMVIDLNDPVTSAEQAVTLYQCFWESNIPEPPYTPPRINV